MSDLGKERRKSAKHNAQMWPGSLKSVGGVASLSILIVSASVTVMADLSARTKSPTWPGKLKAMVPGDSTLKLDVLRRVSSEPHRVQNEGSFSISWIDIGPPFMTLLYQGLWRKIADSWADHRRRRVAVESKRYICIGL
jgi:hypothetical protein